MICNVHNVFCVSTQWNMSLLYNCHCCLMFILHGVKHKAVSKILLTSMEPIICHQCGPPPSFCSQSLSVSLIEPPFTHIIEHITQHCLRANQGNWTNTDHSLLFTCCHTALSLKGKTNREINVCSRSISESGPGSIHFPCCVILDCIVFCGEHMSILGLPCLPTTLN